MDSQPKPVPSKTRRVDERELRDLKRRLKNARRRVAYWSGRPSFLGFGFIPGRGRADCPDTEYEIAMCDVNALADSIERMTGKRPAATDYKREFQDNWSKAFNRRTFTDGTIQTGTPSP